mgnify:CR=1 FL=1
MAAATINSSAPGGGPQSRARRSYLVASVSKLVVLNEHGFSRVTGADWLWELLAWTTFALVVQTLVGYVFLMVWFAWHTAKAQERHWRYIAEYRRDYPPSRKAIVPLIF